ncbi:MAG: hypothetical protein ABII39_06455 [Candidatus Micrarchaeota archaeon]
MIDTFLIRDYNIDQEKLNIMDQRTLIRFVKRICFEMPIKHVIPTLLSPDGVLLIAADGLVPFDQIREVLTDNGYAILFDQPNDPTHVMELSDFNKHLFGARRLN